MFVDKILNLFFIDFQIISSNENFEEFEIVVESLKFNNSLNKILINDFDFLSDDDSILITVKIGESDPYTYRNGDNLNNFLKNISVEEGYINIDENIFFKISITKKINNNSLHIYNFDLFLKYLKNLKTDEFINVFSEIIKRGNYFHFKVKDLKKSFNTKSIYFTDFEKEIDYIDEIERNEILEKFQSICNFNFSGNFYLMPDDFVIIKEVEENKTINEVFNLYSKIISLIFLFDNTSLKDNYFNYKLNGYKVLNGQVLISSDLMPYLNQYYNIYNWVYKGGNIIDKIGLARNIISLHFKNEKEIFLSESTFQSILSSFKIYEKENIKQYIEIRNKISDQLIEFNEYANKIVGSFASGFQKNAFALISFYSSVIVIGVLNNVKFKNIFTIDVFLLSTSFLFISIIYLVLSIWEIKKEKERFKNNYCNMKDRYLDLLTRNDINKILNNDKDYKDNIIFINWKSNTYLCLWVIVIVVLFLTSYYLYYIY